MSTELANIFFVVIGVLGLFASIFGSAIQRGIKQMNLRSILIGVFGLLGIASFAFGLYRMASPDGVTTENAEVYTKGWAAAAGLSITPVQQPPDAHFIYQVTGLNGIPLVVMRSKNRPNYLLLQGLAVVGAGTKARFDSLPEKEKETFALELSTEVARAKIRLTASFYINPSAGPSPGGSLPTNLTIEKLIPITPQLTELQFLDAVDHVSMEVLFIKHAMELTLQRRENYVKP